MNVADYFPLSDGGAVADMHCDLLCYLAGGKGRTPYDAVCRCSVQQLRAGRVALQLLPIFTVTGPGSVESGMAQVSWFSRLLKEYSRDFILYSGSAPLNESHSIAVGLAVENGSSLFAEEEPLDEGFQRIQQIEEQIAKIAYLSMTWNDENRFGGGAHTEIGLKPDGLTLLHFLDGRRIAIDLSHASDALAYGIIDAIEKERLAIPLIASHSNCRSVTNAARNLPDDLIRTIVAAGGVIGFNFVRFFVGPDDIGGFAKHLNHFISLGAGESLCFGADFFYGEDVPPDHRKSPDVLFFPDYNHAGVYQKVIKLWKQETKAEEKLLEKITCQTLHHFLEKVIYGGANAGKSSS